jgi:hypothetical protein
MLEIPIAVPKLTVFLRNVSHGVMFIDVTLKSHILNQTASIDYNNLGGTGALDVGCARCRRNTGQELRHSTTSSIWRTSTPTLVIIYFGPIAFINFISSTQFCFDQLRGFYST